MTAPTPSPSSAPPGGERPIGVLCVDDNLLLGRALGRCIESEPSLQWLGAISDGETVRASVLKLRPDIILMDIDMPGFDTFGMVEELSTALPSTRVIMLSGHVDREYLRRALDAGAWGYLSKAEETAILIEGIRRAHAGEIVLGHEIQALQRSADRF